MATHAGSEGVVKIGTDTVAEVKSYSIEETADTIETSSLGTVARTFRTSLTGWSGSLDVFWDGSDTAGQGALSVGNSVALKVYPEGNATGDVYYEGTALVTGVSRTGSFDGMVEASISVQGTGILTADVAT